MLNRQEQLNLLKNSSFDICIIGGGASGFGCAIAAYNAGYSVCLLDKYDFGKMTSSRSTKLIHGGVRYLEQGKISLVKEALKERKFFLQNFRNTKRQSFLLPCYSWFELLKYRIGLGLYEFLSGKYSLGPSRFISRKQTLKLAPNINSDKLKGAIEYFDGQFDDARLLIDLAVSLIEEGVPVLNYLEATSFIKNNEKISGVRCKDSLTGDSIQINATVVINATGVLTNEVIKLDDEKSEPIIKASRGSHIVVDKSLFPSEHALLVPKTSDGRVLFAIPWLNTLIIGTTDQATDEIDTDPKPTKEELDFIIANFNKYTNQNLSYRDIRSVYSGLRPLAVPYGAKKAKNISRRHKISQSSSGLINLIGGKWTTFRQMGEDTLHFIQNNTPLNIVDLRSLKFIQSNYELKRKVQATLSPRSIYTWDDIEWAIEHEFCYTIEDVLSRRVRILLNDTELALQLAPKVAEMLQKKHSFNDNWRVKSLKSFQQLVKRYSIDSL